MVQLWRGQNSITEFLKTSINLDLSNEENSEALLLNTQLQRRILEKAYERTDFLRLGSLETS